MSRAHVSETVKFWARSLGFDPRQCSGISFRRGGVSVAATQKIAVELRMKQFRWLSEETPHVYTDLGDVEKDKVGAALHRAVNESSVKLARKLSLSLSRSRSLSTQTHTHTHTHMRRS